MTSQGLIGTFAPNHSQRIHGWYPYVEGYASGLVTRELAQLDSSELHLVYDPFGGTGTTPLVAAMSGLDSLYSETNPFMRLVIEAKTNGIKAVYGNKTYEQQLKSLQKSVNEVDACAFEDTDRWDGFEKYFSPEVLSQIIYYKRLVASECTGAAKDIAMVALSSVLVSVSLMTRRGDLRYARESELLKKNQDVTQVFSAKIADILSDIEYCGRSISGNVACVSEDARDLPADLGVDCVITSPPYLNGTNYIRNTKLELKLNDFIENESDLSSLHAKGIVAGINNVSKATASDTLLSEVMSVYEALLPVAYDKRIPKMVASYFNDMNDLFVRLCSSMRDGAYFIMDIGDSQFAGIHIPTHALLEKLATNNGFLKYGEEILRERRSKNGMLLTQRILRFRLQK